MAKITRSVAAAHLTGANKYPVSKKLMFDLDKPIDHLTARAHLRVTYPYGYVVAIHPNSIGPQGGMQKARYFQEAQAFTHSAEKYLFFVAHPTEEQVAADAVARNEAIEQLAKFREQHPAITRAWARR